MSVITIERYEPFGGYYLAESVTDSGRVVLVEAEEPFEAMFVASTIASLIEEKEEQQEEEF